MSDSKNIIDRLSQVRDDISYFNDIIEDCRFFTRNFEEVVFNYVRRSSNRVAYGLAEFAQSMEFQALIYWMDEIHFSIMFLVVFDDLN